MNVMSSKFEIDFLEDNSKEALIKELHRIQKIVGDRSVIGSDVTKYGKVGKTTYVRKFGSFSNALLAAGLKPSKRCNVSDDELLNSVIELWTKTLEKEGRRPFASDLKKYCALYEKKMYWRRFGSWKKTLLLAYKLVDKQENNASKENIPIEKSIPKNIRKEPSDRIKFQIMKRDKFTCVLCGKSGRSLTSLEVDHKIPVSKGGTNDFDNLQTLCFECNRGKRNDNE
jgi:5-methylcytosine-specific restriction endonuclease McrA